jgi:ketosteroid isomerase-like protein
MRSLPLSCLPISRASRVSTVRICLPALIFAALLMPLAASAQQSVEDQVRSVEQKTNAAYAANNLPLYFSNYASDFIGWFPEGRTNLPAYKKEWTAYIAAGNRIVSVQLEDEQIQVSPARDAAIASYLLHVQEKTKRGVANELYHETDVLFHRNGAWKIVEVHYSPVPVRRGPQS